MNWSLDLGDIEYLLINLVDVCENNAYAYQNFKRSFRPRIFSKELYELEPGQEPYMRLSLTNHTSLPEYFTFPKMWSNFSNPQDRLCNVCLNTSAGSAQTRSSGIGVGLAQYISRWS